MNKDICIECGFQCCFGWTVVGKQLLTQTTGTYKLCNKHDKKTGCTIYNGKRPDVCIDYKCNKLKNK